MKRTQKLWECVFVECGKFTKETCHAFTERQAREKFKKMLNGDRAIFSVYPISAIVGKGDSVRESA